VSKACKPGESFLYCNPDKPLEKFRSELTGNIYRGGFKPRQQSLLATPVPEGKPFHVVRVEVTDAKKT
jgi:hypothetical protein